MKNLTYDFKFPKDKSICIIKSSNFLHDVGCYYLETKNKECCCVGNVKSKIEYIVCKQQWHHEYGVAWGGYGMATWTIQDKFKTKHQAELFVSKLEYPCGVVI